MLFTLWITDSDPATRIKTDPYGSEAVATSVVDRHHFDAESDPACHLYADPDPTFHFDSDPDPDPSFQIKVQNLVKVFK
jgi:hypothetical protein